MQLGCVLSSVCAYSIRAQVFTGGCVIQWASQTRAPCLPLPHTHHQCFRPCFAMATSWFLPLYSKLSATPAGQVLSHTSIPNTCSALSLVCLPSLFPAPNPCSPSEQFILPVAPTSVKSLPPPPLYT